MRFVKGSGVWSGIGLNGAVIGHISYKSGLGYCFTALNTFHRLSTGDGRSISQKLGELALDGRFLGLIEESISKGHFTVVVTNKSEGSIKSAIGNTDLLKVINCREDNAEEIAGWGCADCNYVFDSGFTGDKRLGVAIGSRSAMKAEKERKIIIADPKDYSELKPSYKSRVSVGF